MDEFTAINRFAKRQTISREDVIIGIGDDGAVVASPPDSQLVLVSDNLVEGIHFFPDTKPHAIGYKALAVNLSDLAAMGARPSWALVNLAIPQLDEHWMDQFTAGLLELSTPLNLQFIGGDTTRGPLTVGIQVGGWLPSGTAITRSRALPGHSVYVSGRLGDAALAVKHGNGEIELSISDREYVLDALDYPVPRLELGIALRGLASAAIDISDGLASDLGHLVNASRVGARVDITKLLLSDCVKRYQRDNPGTQIAINSGDDYELCFTAPPEHHTRILDLSKSLDIPISEIGKISASDGCCFIGENGQELKFNMTGYNHFPADVITSE